MSIKEEKKAEYKNILKILDKADNDPNLERLKYIDETIFPKEKEKNKKKYGDYYLYKFVFYNFVHHLENKPLKRKNFYDYVKIIFSLYTIFLVLQIICIIIGLYIIFQFTQNEDQKNLTAYIILSTSLVTVLFFITRIYIENQLSKKEKEMLKEYQESLDKQARAQDKKFDSFEKKFDSFEKKFDSFKDELKDEIFDSFKDELKDEIKEILSAKKTENKQ